LTPVYFPAVTEYQQMSGKTIWHLFVDPSNRFAVLTGILALWLILAIFFTGSDAVRRHTFDMSRCPRTCKDCKAWFLVLFAGFFMWPLLLCRCIGRRFSREDPETPSTVTTNKKVGGFQLFWAAHKNWVIIFGLMLVHGPQFWIWFMWPLMLIICDRLLQRQRRKSTVRLQSAELLKANVMKLTFKQPRGFLYQAGHYAQIACEQVSQEEWHPFTISSAPEEGCLTMHIRCPDELDWCSALRRTLIEEPVKTISCGKATAKPGCRVTFGHFRMNGLPGQEDEDLKYDLPHSVELAGAGGGAGSTFKAAEPVNKGIDQTKIDIDEVSVSGLMNSFPVGSIRMWLDGPHGAPSELVWVHRTVILVGAGIGVTPFASILRSIQARAQSDKSQPLRLSAARRRPSQPASSSAGHQQLEDEDWQPCQKVYFYWLCRGQDEIEWFYDMLREATQGATAGRVDVNLFTTGEIELSKVKPLGCGFHQFFGRPNWGRIFPKLAEQHPGDDIGVFLCGPSALRGDLANGVRKAKTQCAMHNTKFSLHAENF